jgi:endonuclease G
MNGMRGEQARRFLGQILPEAGDERGSLEAMGAPGDAVEAILPSGPFPPGLTDSVHRAAEKFVGGQPLDEIENFALEAIIIPDKRPAVDIEQGDYTVSHKDWLHLNEPSAKKTIRAAIPAIGRVELPGHPSLPYGGTGFVVGAGLLMTNRHVAEIFSGGLGARDLVFRPGHRAGIDFDRERQGGSRFLEVREVAMIHPYWDMALLRVERLPETIVPLRLSLQEPEQLKGRDVAVLGYPAFDPRNDAAVQNLVFQGVYDVKRLMPGKLTGRSSIPSFGKDVPSAMHDGSTLGGASGSAVVDVASGEIVALHFAGIYLKSNYGVPAVDLARDPRVADQGVQFAGDPTPGPGPWDEWWSRVEPIEAGAGASFSTAGRANQSVAVSVGAAHWTIPIEISLKVGVPEPAAGGPAAAQPTEKAVEPIDEQD